MAGDFGNHGTDLVKSDVTAVVISSGEDTVLECLSALSLQSYPVKIKMITDIYPMSAAFNMMAEIADTPLVVQVDADMVLAPDCIERLVRGIKKSLGCVYRFSGQLEEPGFGPGGAVKIWRRSVLTKHRFKDCRTVDRELDGRLRRRFLFQMLDANTVAYGVHKARHSNVQIAIKLKSDVEKWRFLKRPFHAYAQTSLERALQESDHCANLGIILGILSSTTRVNLSKNLFLERFRLEKICYLLDIDFEELSNRFFLNTQRGCHELLSKLYEAKVKYSEKRALISMLTNIHDEGTLSELHAAIEL